MADEAGDPGHATIAGQIAARIGARVAPRPAARVQGGCINDGFRWDSSAGPLFVKVAGAASLPMFEAEVDGLLALARADALRVPAVLAYGAAGADAWLALEWIDLRTPDRRTQAWLGERLALQHRHTAEGFGWQRDNTIGSSAQVNAWSDDWPSFFRERRLGVQFELAQRNGHGAPLQARGAKLLQQVSSLLAGHRPSPSLLHGDLWGGNAAADPSGAPVVFDPAVYYGDREADLAMTRLFGGFSSDFHAAYEAAWPLPPGSAERVDLYNLYHILNHLNLFGTGYLGQAMRLIDSLLARSHC